MTKLHELKIKYEQSQLAERDAWGVLQGYATGNTTCSSDEAYRDYKAELNASAAWRQANRTYVEDSLLYRAESNRRSAIVTKVLTALVFCLVTVVIFGALPPLGV
jgi:hypothetical protein